MSVILVAQAQPPVLPRSPRVQLAGSRHGCCVGETAGNLSITNTPDTTGPSRPSKTIEENEPQAETPFTFGRHPIPGNATRAQQ